MWPYSPGFKFFLYVREYIVPYVVCLVEKLKATVFGTKIL